MHTFFYIPIHIGLSIQQLIATEPFLTLFRIGFFKVVIIEQIATVETHSLKMLQQPLHSPATEQLRLRRTISSRHQCSSPPPHPGSTALLYRVSRLLLLFGLPRIWDSISLSAPKRILDWHTLFMNTKQSPRGSQIFTVRSNRVTRPSVYNFATGFRPKTQSKIFNIS